MAPVINISAGAIVHFHFGDEGLAVRLDGVLALLASIKKGETDLALDLAALKSAVESETDLKNAVKAALDGLAAKVKDLGDQIKNMDPAAAQAQIDQFVATIKQNNQSMADAVVANTGSGGGTVPVPDPSAP